MKRVLAFVVAVTVLLLAVFFGWREVSAPATTRMLTPAPSEHRAEPSEPSAIAPSSPTAPAIEPASEQRAVVDGPVAPPKPTRWTPTLLRVRVVSTESGEPAADEQVALIDAHKSGLDDIWPRGQWHAKPGQAATTNADGIVEFAAEPGVDYRAWVMRDAMPMNAIAVPALAANETREIKLSASTAPDSIVRGRLVDDDTNRPVAGGVVHCVVWRASAKLDQPVAAADDGTFELQLRSWITYETSATAPGYARERIALPAKDLANAALEVRMSRAATLEVTVLDKQRAPLHAQIEAKASLDEPWTATTDDAGRAVLGELPSHKPFELSVRAGGRDPRVERDPIELLPGETRRIEIVIGSGATVVGHVEDATGGSVADIEIWRTPSWDGQAELMHALGTPAARTRTDADGRFVLDDVPAGAWLVGVPLSRAVEQALSGRPEFDANGMLVAHPLSDADLVCSVGQVLTVDAGVKELEVALRIERAGYLRGTVLDPNGAPAPQCQAWAAMNGNSLSVHASTDAHGAFTLGPLPPGTFRVSAGGLFGNFTSSEPVEAHIGDSNIVLHLRPGAVIGGRVVGSARECEVLVCRRTEDDDDQETALVSNKGVWSSGAREPGVYDVYVTTADGSCARVTGIELHAGETRDDVELVLQPGAHVAMRYGGGAAEIGVELRIDGHSLASFYFDDDEPHEKSMPPGDYEVRWLDGNDKVIHSQKITLAAGEDREIAWDGKP